MFRVFNTLTKQKEDFIPLHKQTVGVYHCGPTVYGPVHIGNLRAYVFADILRRTLEWNKYTVKQVMNITDVGHLVSDNDEGEDKMTKGLRREGLPLTLDGMKTLADRYTSAFENDLEKLNIKHPHYLPRASEHIPEQLALITALDQKGFVYRTSDGLYFDTSKDSSYGKLAGLSKGTDTEYARIQTNTEKKNPRDFALWKFNSELGWESPWGKGFPGWHIECSAMSMKYLGETFDIHTGGIDHIPVHHTNEIAQSENATGKPFVHYWMHGAFLNIAGEKIAKSTGNTFYLQDIINRGISPLAYRYWLLTAHYRSPLNFTWEALESAAVAHKKLCQKINGWKSLSKGTMSELYTKRFTEVINDDLNTPQGIALIWEIMHDDSVSDADAYATISLFDIVLGIIESPSNNEQKIPQDVAQLVAQRETARKNKDWESSDRLRQEIETHGFVVNDSPQGSTILKKQD